MRGALGLESRQMRAVDWQQARSSFHPVEGFWLPSVTLPFMTTAHVLMVWQSTRTRPWGDPSSSCRALTSFSSGIAELVFTQCGLQLSPQTSQGERQAGKSGHPNATLRPKAAGLPASAKCMMGAEEGC